MSPRARWFTPWLWCLAVLVPALYLVAAVLAAAALVAAGTIAPAAVLTRRAPIEVTEATG